MWNAISLVQDLNSCRRVPYPATVTITPRAPPRLLHSHMQIHPEHNDTMIMRTRQWRRATQFFEKYTSHFIWKVWQGYSRFYGERELETEQNCNILTPTLMAISVVSFLFSRAAQPEARGPTLPGAGFLYRILSTTGLQTHWLPVFNELYNSSFIGMASLIVIKRK